MLPPVSTITAAQRDSALGDGYLYDLTPQIVGFQQNGTVNLAAGTVSAPATTNNMAFDGCGNRTNLNGVAQTFDNLNQLTSAAGIGYNTRGDLTIWNGWNCTYDAQNRLTSASSASSTLSFYYDAKNRQIARSINNGTDTVNTFSVWDDWELIEEYTTGNVRTAAFVQGAHGPIKSLVGNTVYYYQDSLGSTSHIATATGALLEYYKYDLNGKPTYWSASGTQITAPAPAYNVRDLFTGERYIPEMGMYDLRNRFYSPDLGRFLQPDPIGFKGDGSNLYRYCGNDWANRIDPDGLAGSAPVLHSVFTQTGGGLWSNNALNSGLDLYFASTIASKAQPAGNDSAQKDEGAKPGQQQTGRFYTPGRVGISKTKDGNPADHGYNMEWKMQVLTRSGEPLPVPGMKVKETLTTLYKESNSKKLDFAPVKINNANLKGEFADSIGLGGPPPAGLTLHTIRDQHYEVYFPRDGKWHSVPTVLRQEVKFQDGVREKISLSVIRD